jgi:acyl-coenzyme A synthetase/AMP-(fatty) acid ligase
MQPLPAGVIQDSVPFDAPGAREIGFNIPARYNASEVLFRNLNEGHRLALTGPCGQVTYHELCAAAERWGNAFLSLGLHRGDRIVFFLDDTPVYPAAFFGAVRAGLVPLLINLLTPSDLLQFYLADSGATIAVTEAACVEKFNATACANTELKTLVIVNGQVVSASSVGTINAASWLRTFSSALVPADTHRDEMAFWMYLSGSTGRPKGIVHLQHDMIYTDLAYARSILRLTPDDICFSVPKIFFAYGLGNSITFPFCAGAASLLLPGQPKPAAIFEAIAAYRPTVFFALPTLYTALAKAPEPSSLQLAVSAAEILSAEVFNAWKGLSGLEVVEGLGSTEVLHIYLSNTPQRKKLGSAGMRVPGYKWSYGIAKEKSLRKAMRAFSGCAAIPARRSTGTVPSRAPRRFARAAGSIPATGSCVTPMGSIFFADAPTISSRSPASGSFRSRWSCVWRFIRMCGNAPCWRSSCRIAAPRSRHSS